METLFDLKIYLSGKEEKKLHFKQDKEEGGNLDQYRMQTIFITNNNIQVIEYNKSANKKIK